jgi:uncharacterized protein YidB (DUF937 family)
LIARLVCHRLAFIAFSGDGQMGILDILLGAAGGARGGQGSGGGQSGGLGKIGMALIALMLWQWYKSRAGGAAQAPAPVPAPGGNARVPSPAPARVPQDAPVQMPKPSAGGDSDSDFGPLADPRSIPMPGGRGGGGQRGRPMDDEEEADDGRGGGSLGDILNDILRGGRGGGMQMPDDEETDGPSRGRGPRGGRGMPRGGDGGLGDILGDILGGGRGFPGQRAMGGGANDPLSELLQSAGIGGLGGLLAGGASGGVLGDILKQFEQSGQGDAARSWISHGENVPVTPKDIEKTFGSDIIGQLAEQFGLDKNELLKGLSETLPQVVDQLTPDGRLPTEQELVRRG